VCWRKRYDCRLTIGDCRLIVEDREVGRSERRNPSSDIRLRIVDMEDKMKAYKQVNHMNGY